MDAKERHELKDNDLAEFLENFGAFWDKQGNKISAIILIVVVGWFGYRYYNTTQVNRHESAWADLADTNTPPGYRERAKENAGNIGLANLALLRGAEAFHKQAINPDSDMISSTDSLDSAVAMYKQVLDSDVDPVFLANAAVGLANVEETRGDFASAKSYWTQAQQIAESNRLDSIAAQARIRLTMLDDLAKPIIFADPKPVTDATDDTPTEADGTATKLSAEATPVEVPAAEEVVAPADPG